MPQVALTLLCLFSSMFGILNVTPPPDTSQNLTYWTMISAGKMPLQATGADNSAREELDAEHDSAPEKAIEQPAAKPAAAKGRGSAIASMWSKAPPKKAGKAALKQTPAPPSAKSKASAVDAEAFLRLNQQVRALPSSLYGKHGTQHLTCV